MARYACISRLLFITQLDDATVRHGSVVLKQPSSSVDRDFVIHYVHSTPPLILIVFSGLDRGIQSATEMLLSLEKEGEGVAHSFNCTPSTWMVCLANALG